MSEYPTQGVLGNSRNAPGLAAQMMEISDRECRQRESENTCATPKQHTLSETMEDLQKHAYESRRIAEQIHAALYGAEPAEDDSKCRAVESIEDRAHHALSELGRANQQLYAILERLGGNDG